MEGGRKGGRLSEMSSPPWAQARARDPLGEG